MGILEKIKDIEHEMVCEQMSHLKEQNPEEQSHRVSFGTAESEVSKVSNNAFGAGRESWTKRSGI